MKKHYNVGKNNSNYGNPREIKGILHPNYKHGKTLIKHFCKDCETELKHYKSIRCRRCADKYHGIMMRGKNNVNYNPNSKTHQKCPECGKKIGFNSKRCLSCCKKGSLNNFYGRTIKIKRYRYKKYCFRSSWELKYAQFLDRRGIQWLYEPKFFKLSNTTYTPDFYLSKEDTYIEIKGYMSEENKRKIKEFKNTYKYINLEILYKSDLLKLGIKL